ncbi:hypothetical protein [Methylobacterium nodulans]|uniref:Uncharacterized protein n=1 Tax=Methylobacterium nodulans (strain LMG 21967 / CNCM I-2342 / ORS 2060) TaxID=460265 RepID=B8ICM3_METNO|nr:hypothetical protein [Methylobacterium nodulans]ACL57434.1 hypothetical protein Mnod_2464 [Methylobacterium nodulans ORS 2060]
MADTPEQPFTPVVGDDGRMDFEVGLTTLCLWADCSDETILKLARASVIKRYGKGRYRLREALVARLRYLQDEQRRATKSAGESRLKDKRAEEIDMRLEERSGALINEARAEALAIVDEFAGPLRADLMSIPARVTKDLALRRQIETHIDDAFGAAAKRAADTAGGAGPAGEAVGAKAADKPRRVGTRKPRVSPQRRRTRFS